MKEKLVHYNTLPGRARFTNPTNAFDAAYKPPLEQDFSPDGFLLKKLRSLTLPDVGGPTVSEKIHATENDALALSNVWESHSQQEYWPAFLSFIWRDQPDGRNMKVTFLPNRDTVAVLLAIRLGLQTEVAVALAHQDLIYFAELDIGKAAFTPSYYDSALLGTFTGNNTGIRMALFARAQAATFSTSFKKHELILLRETGEAPLSHDVNGHYPALLKTWLRCRTDEVVSAARTPHGSSK
jgi:hypothetical protein